jgi:hypothetical protein
MALVEDYYGVEALTAKRTDDAFDICISATVIAPR